MSPIDAGENYRKIRASLPPEVRIVAAAKTRTPHEVRDVIAAGASIIGENYVQEGELHRASLGDVGRAVEWHMIGHLQRNKINKALPIFDVFQGVDSMKLARAMAKRADGPLRVLVEVNVGGEDSKSGVAFEEAAGLLRGISGLGNLCVEGLMAMEPYCADPEDARPYFKRMRRLQQSLAEDPPPNVALDILCMGMTHSYRVAVEEGANMVRIGTAIFGPRE